MVPRRDASWPNRKPNRWYLCEIVGGNARQTLAPGKAPVPVSTRLATRSPPLLYNLTIKPACHIWFIVVSPSVATDDDISIGKSNPIAWRLLLGFCLPVCCLAKSPAFVPPGPEPPESPLHSSCTRLILLVERARGSRTARVTI